MLCQCCSRPLTGDEIALNRKLVSREAATFSCLSCLATSFGTTEERLRKKILEFKRAGCLLFLEQPDNPREIES